MALDGPPRAALTIPEAVADGYRVGHVAKQGDGFRFYPVEMKMEL